MNPFNSEIYLMIEQLHEEMEALNKRKPRSTKKTGLETIVESMAALGVAASLAMNTFASEFIKASMKAAADFEREAMAFREKIDNLGIDLMTKQYRQYLLSKAPRFVHRSNRMFQAWGKIVDWYILLEDFWYDFLDYWSIDSIVKRIDYLRERLP